MADWIICPSCNLRHSRRADARCPRCRESVERATGEPVATVPPIEPGRRVTTPPPPPVATAENRPPASWAAGQSAPLRPVRPVPRPASANDRGGWRGSPPASAPGPSGLDATWLVHACRTRAVRAFSTAVALLAIGLLLLVGQSRYFTNFFGGPYSATAQDLDAIHDPAAAPRYFVHVEGSRAIDLGLEEYEVRTEYGRETGRTLKGRFYALEVGDRFLVVKTAGGVDTVVEGELRPVYGELESHLFSSAEMRAVRQRFRPYFLDTGSFRAPGYWGLGLGSAFFALAGWWAARSWRRLRAPASDPLVQRVAAWGDPVAVSAEIAAERERPWRKAGHFEITEHYVVNASFYRLDVLRLGDLLWAYKKVIKKSVNFVPVGKDYQAVLACVGGTAEVQTKDAEVDEILHYAAARAPWAVFGHDKEIEQVFRKDPAGFVAAVADRRRQHEAGEAAAIAS
jgi:hypothetical protein